VSRWLRLYPSWWSERHGEEFDELVAASARRGLWLAVDIGRGALDAHLHGRPNMAGTFNDAALRRGVYDGAIVSAVIAVVALLTNVVFPPGRNESDSEPHYVVWQLAGFAVLAMLFVVIGARARRRSDTTRAGPKGGAAAGIVIAVAVTVIFLVMNNLFLDIVSQQHDKRVAFAASGWSSMRAYLSVSQLEGGLLAIPVGAVVGAALGFFGGVISRPQGHSRPLK
jgi:lysylphosphatidylglycerol synthetase-like protein (DUF2156 family)